MALRSGPMRSSALQLAKMDNVCIFFRFFLSFFQFGPKMFTFPLESLHTHHTSINIKANTSKNQFWGSLSLKRERAPKPEKHNKNTKNTKKHTNKKNINKHKKTQKNTKVGQEGLRVSIDITIGSYVPYDVGIINGRLVNGRLVRRR